MNWQEFTALAANHGLRRALSFVCAVPAGTGSRLLKFNRAMAAILVATAVWMLFL
ncbi:hypothetical protein [Polaromonas sp.]|jgi:hypothetical protein|uniref:hypothetical protein n=1 Tax=Polaromonas sp. TaxID=1869339 RepID=UPI003BB638B0